RVVLEALEATATVDGIARPHVHPTPSRSAAECRRSRSLRLAYRPSVTLHRQGHANGVVGRKGFPGKEQPERSPGVLPLLLHWHPEDASGLVRGLALRSTVDALLRHERTTRLADR